MKKLLVILVLITLVTVTTVIVKNYSKPEIKNYEYYTFEGKLGTSHKCDNREKIECEIRGNMVEVMQYAEVNK